MENKKEEQAKVICRPVAKKPEEESFSARVEKFFLGLVGVPAREKLFFVRHLGVMLKGGIPFSAAFRALAEQTKNRAFAKILKKVSVDIDRGLTLSESLKPYEKVFNEFFINMIESGEISGKLEEVLNQLYIHMKKQHELVSSVKSALTYPAFVITAMGGIGIFMMVSIVPKITGVFSEYQTELPLATKVVIAVSSFMIENGVFTAVSAVVTILAIIKILQTKKGLYAFQALLLKIPVLSDMVKKMNIARFSRTVSSLLKTDIMIIKTFQITAGIIANLHYRKVILEISEKIKKGGLINETIKNYPDFFPPVVTQMIMVGEQTGELDNILADLAEFYEEEVEKTLETLPTLIEPLLILILGAGVGLMAIAVIMPMYSLTTAV